MLQTDVRLIAATNVKLIERVSEKRFRSNLNYRLNIFPIVILPLRERVIEAARRALARAGSDFAL